MASAVQVVPFLCGEGLGHAILEQLAIGQLCQSVIVRQEVNLRLGLFLIGNILNGADNSSHCAA